jgi:predicted SAM-dependent methyltransferase
MQSVKTAVNLNVASGHYVLNDFINIDNSLFLRLLPIYPLIRPFVNEARRHVFKKFIDAKNKATLIRHNCVERLPFENNSVDHILCSHFIEHVYREEAERIVAGFFDVLKPNGTLHVIVPDIKKMAAKYLSNDADIAADQFIEWIGVTKQSRPKLLVQCMELSGGFGLFHRWMYDEASLMNLLASIGFVIESTNDTISRNWRADNNYLQVNLLARKPGL